MEELRNLTHLPFEFFWGLIAICGGIARYLVSFTLGAPFSIGILMASAFTAGFSGYMFALLGKTLQMAPDTIYVMAGVGGFFGDQSMKLILEYFTRRVGPPISIPSHD